MTSACASQLFNAALLRVEQPLIELYGRKTNCYGTANTMATLVNINDVMTDYGKAIISASMSPIECFKPR